MMKKTKRITHFNEKNNKTRTNSLDNDKKQQIKSNVAMILIHTVSIIFKKKKNLVTISPYLVLSRHLSQIWVNPSVLWLESPRLWRITIITY